MKKTLILSLLLGLLAFPVFSEESSVHVIARVWPTKVTLGDEIKLAFAVRHPKDVSLIPLTTKIPEAPFEVKSVEPLTTQEQGQEVEESFLVKLTLFELGDFQLPPIAIRYSDAWGRVHEEWTAPISIKVLSVIKNKKDKQEIRPIKGPIILDTRLITSLILGSVALALTLFLIAKVILRQRAKIPIDPESLLPPHERVNRELDRLLEKGFISAGRNKEFYSELADILRRYLERRFQIEAFEMTTAELVAVLKIKEFDSRLTERIKSYLINSDLVKFAKFSPPKSLSDEMILMLKDIVDFTPPAEAEVVG